MENYIIGTGNVWVYGRSKSTINLNTVYYNTLSGWWFGT